MFLSVMALSSEINQHMIFPTQYIKGLLIKIYDYAIWRNAIWRNIGIQNQKPNTLSPNNHNKESLAPSDDPI